MDKYKVILSTIEPIFKERKWKRKGDSFYLQKTNIGIINFQKSKDSTKDEISFTINLGVFSTSLGDFLGESSKNISVWECHWKKRIGSILPMKKDYWWTINNMTNEKQYVVEIIDIIEKIAIPEVESHISDDALEQMWLSGDFGGLTELERFINLTSILKIYNKDNLRQISDEMKAYFLGKPLMLSVKAHLKGLGIE